MNIKVTVDYKRGCYSVTGLTEGPNGGKFNEIQKTISGVDDDGRIKYNYTDKKLIEKRKKELRSTIKKIMKKNPKFKVSRNALKKVDLLMFITLKRWDEQINNTSNYATKYLMAVIQEFDNKDNRGLFKKEFEKKCVKARADSLKNAGIDITYNVGMLGVANNLSFLDRIIGIRIAKIQKKLIGAKVINKPIVQTVNTVYDNRSIYTDLPHNFDIPKDFEDRIINKTMEQIQLQNEIKYKKEVSSDEDLLDFDGEDDIVNNIALNLEHDRKNGIFDRQEIIEEDWLDFDGEDDIVNNIALNLKHDRKNGVFNRQEKASVTVESTKQLQKEIKEEREKIDLDEVASLGQIGIKQNTNSKEIARQAKIINEMAQKTKQSLEKMNKELKQLNEKSKFGTVVTPVSEFTTVEEKEDNETKNIATESKTSEKIISIEREKARKGIWTEKISDPKDSLKNKKFNPNRRKFKERAVRVAITLLAAGSVGFAAYNVNKAGDVLGKNNNTKVGYEKDDTNDLIDMKKTVTVNLAKPTKAKVNPIKQTVKKQEAEIKENINTKIKVEKKSETETETNLETPKVAEKTEQERMEEFRDFAVQKYIDTFVIGQKPSIGDMFDGETFSERPDGGGRTGSFDNYSNYELEHITIMTPKGNHTESVNGESLQEILNKYPDYTGYGLHFLNTDTGKGLGFVTENQLEKIINNEVNSIMKNKKTINTIKNDAQNNDER